MTGAGTIEARLQRVEDELAILRVMLDYSTFLDARDYDGYVNLFAPDGEWGNAEGIYKGRAAIHEMLLHVMGPANERTSAAYHLNSNPRVDVDGDRATGFIRYLYMLRGPDGRRKPRSPDFIMTSSCGWTASGRSRAALPKRLFRPMRMAGKTSPLK